VGVGCLDDFGAASALLHLGATLPESGEFPGSEASASVSGDIFLGAQWHVAIRPGVLIVGTSADSTVRSFKPLIDQTATHKHLLHFVDKIDDARADDECQNPCC